LLVPCLGLALAAGLWVAREPLQEAVRTGSTLANDAPTTEAVEEMIMKSADAKSALLAAWNSGKIVHREIAMASVSRVFPGTNALPSDVEALVLAGTLDPDFNVRESAFGVLRVRNHPQTFPAAVKLLGDPDQRVRLLGLSQIKMASPQLGVPTAAVLLEDPDVAVLGLSLKLLENWSGQQFGSKLADTVQVEDRYTGLQEFQSEGVARTRAAAEKARLWWLAHRDQFPAPADPDSTVGVSLPPRILAPDFELKDQRGRLIRLSSFRGQVVVLNFWTTWCTACVGEIPALVALQRQYSDRVVILGVSLDYVPDSHGHIGGHAAVEEQHQSDGDHDDHEATGAALKRVREKVGRVARTRGINYAVLLDEHNDVGGRYNGGELPTTVLVDAQGFIRRRFIGPRSLPVFEAMIAEAMTPFPTVASSVSLPE